MDRRSALGMLGATAAVVTDGACMTSSANQNPSITSIALTARACAYAVT